MNLVDIYNKNPNFVRQLGGFKMLDAKMLGGSVDAEGNTLLHKAAINNDMTTFNSIKAVLPVNAQERVSFMNIQNLHGDTAAHIAVRHGNHAMVTAMRNMGSDLSIANKNNEYILSSESENVFTQDAPSQAGGGDSDGFPAALSPADPYIAPKMPTYDSPSFNSPNTINDYSSDIFISNKMHGGDNASDAFDSPSSLSDISTEGNYMIGGGSKSIRGVRTLYFEDMLTSDSEMLQDGGKKLKESSQMHEDAIRMIMDMGYSEDDARVIKAAIYRMVKDKYPNANNLERAKKMLENIDSAQIAQINLADVRLAISKNREAKSNIKGKEPKKTEGKAKKATKTASKKATKTASKKKASKRTTRK